LAPDVAIVNQTMARRYWNSTSPIGASVTVDGRPRRIIGIVSDYAYHSVNDNDASPVVYLPLAQGLAGYGYVIIAMRTRTEATALASSLRNAVNGLDGSVPLEDVRTLAEVTGEQYQMSRIPAELLGVYALSSVFVAMMGLYAVMAYSVLERHREFALRMALGSTRGRIFRLVLHESTGIAIIGLAAGGLGSIAAVRFLRSMLFGVVPFDPLSYSVAAALLLLTVLLSGLLPARRAAVIEPMRALRSE
jgi:ABC-type antimicrobial peptide transport system permease subunit